jgi:hypothetical protein
MSLWLKRKDKDGKTHIYALPNPLILIPLLAILIGLLLPIVQAIRAWLGG